MLQSVLCPKYGLYMHLLCMDFVCMCSCSDTSNMQLPYNSPGGYLVHVLFPQCVYFPINGPGRPSGKPRYCLNGKAGISCDRVFWKSRVRTSSTTQCRSQPKNWGGGKMVDFRRITLFCLEKCLSKHKMTTFSKNLRGDSPFASPPWLRLCHHQKWSAEPHALPLLLQKKNTSSDTEKTNYTTTHTKREKFKGKNDGNVQEEKLHLR